MKNRNIYIVVIVNNNMNKIKSLGYAALVAGSLLFPKYTVANDTMSEPKTSSKLELALEDSELSFGASNPSSQKKKKDKEVFYAFALDWNDKNNNKKAETSEVVGIQENFKNGVYTTGENPCYILKSSNPKVRYSVSKDGREISSGVIEKKGVSTLKIDLPNEGPGQYKLSVGRLNAKYQVK